MIDKEEKRRFSVFFDVRESPFVCQWKHFAVLMKT